MGNLKELLSILDLNELLNLYTTPLLNGIEKITTDLLIIATLFGVIEFTINCIKNFGNDREYNINFG